MVLTRFGTDRSIQKPFNEWFEGEMGKIVEKYRGKKVPEKVIDALRKELKERSLECAAKQIALDN